MSEADTPTNLVFPELVNSANSTEVDQANPSSCNSPDETQALAIVPKPQAKNRQFVDFHAFFSWVKATENDLAALTPSEKLKIVALIQELRWSNSNLLNRVNQLEQALDECQKVLQLHKERSHTAELMLSQQTQKLAAVQDQERCLFHELEASHQNAQRQQILIETLTAQIESSQERVAQMERECALTQASYNEQSYKLVQTENTCQELRTRLTRQQHHTLQFKFALEKCLEMPVPSYQSQADPNAFSPIPANSEQLANQSFFPKVQPIPPWSAEPQSLVTVEEAEEQRSGGAEEQRSGGAEEQRSGGAGGVTDLEELHLLIEDTSEAEEVDGQDLVNLLEAVEEPVTANLPDNAPEGTTVAPSPDLNFPTQLDEPLNQSESALQHLPDDTGSEQLSSDQTDQLQLTGSPQHGNKVASDHFLPQETRSFTSNANWPSPMIYPSRPPKKRKSLAAIELPTFSPISAQKLGVRS